MGAYQGQIIPLISDAESQELLELAGLLRMLAEVRTRQNVEGLEDRVLRGIERWERLHAGKPRGPDEGECPTGEQWPWDCGDGVPVREGGGR